jgi:hypothetical protein
MIFEVLTTVKMSMLVFWAVVPCVGRYQQPFSPEDGEGMLLRNVSVDLLVHTAIQSRRTISVWWGTLLLDT